MVTVLKNLQPDHLSTPGGWFNFKFGLTWSNGTRGNSLKVTQQSSLPSQQSMGMYSPFWTLLSLFWRHKFCRKNFLRLSKTIHLCQHCSFVSLALKGKEKDFCCSERILTPTPAIALPTALPLSAPKNCHTLTFSLSSDPCWPCIEVTTHIQPFPAPWAHSNENSPLLPLARTHLRAEIPSGT